MGGEKLGGIPTKESVPRSSQLYCLLFPLYKEISSTTIFFSQKVILSQLKPITDPELDMNEDSPEEGK